MQKHLILFIALFIGCSSIAQVNLDSLWGVWNDKSQSDTNRLKAMRKIAWDGYLFSKPDSAFYFAQMQYDFAKSKNNKKWMAIALNINGVSFMFRSDYTKAISYFTQSFNIFQKIGDQEWMAKPLNNMGGIYEYQNNYNKALDCYIKSLEISKQINDMKSMSNSLNNIGNIYYYQGNYSKSIDYYSRSLKISEKLGNKREMISPLNNIGGVYYIQKDYNQAIAYYNRTLKIREELDDKKGLADYYTNIGNVYRNLNDSLAITHYITGLNLYEDINDKKGMANILNLIGGFYYGQHNYKKAQEYYLRSMKISQELDNKQMITYTFIGIGLIYKDQGNYSQAIIYYTKALKLAKEIDGAVDEIKKVSKYLYELYNETNRYQQAIEMYKLHILMRDSINRIENKEAVIKLKYQYEYETQAAIDSVDNLRIQQVKDKEITRQQAELKIKQDEQIMLVGGLSLVVLFSLFMINRFRVTNRQKKIIEVQKVEVEKQKEQVEEKNKEILDSIQYAKRLQEAILPPTKLVKEWLPRSFILYKPKDIVAGDFYWMESVKGWIYFAAADCTGHGVPGAMVSVVCSNALSISLLDEGKTKPSEILDRTRELVIERFGRSENEINDGMDISLCAFNYKTGKMQWAGANNPLWIIRSGAEEVEEIRADRQPIGSHLHKDPFNNHELQLNSGDSVYLFSDGYPDQFGGEKGKKYKSANLKHFLLSIQDKEMETQRTLLSEEFNRWKGTYEQIDDVCVMGVRI